jgi:hypothetical protein
MAHATYVKRAINVASLPTAGEMLFGFEPMVHHVNLVRAFICHEKTMRVNGQHIEPSHLAFCWFVSWWDNL